MKKLFQNKWFSYVVKYAFVVSAILYLLSCLTPFVHPKYFFGFTFLAIGFPLLLLVMLLWLVFYLFVNKKKSLLIVLMIVFGYKNIVSNIGFVFFKNETTITKLPRTIKLLSWNVRDFTDDVYLGKKKRGSERYFEFIKQTNADVVCLQDVDNIINEWSVPAFIYIRDSLHYPYTYFSVDIDTFIAAYKGREQYGTCIFSKYPITSSNHINYSGKHFTESLGFADVLVDSKTVRFYNTHLRSMYINLPKEQKLTDFKYVVDDTNLIMHSSAFTKVKHFDTSHIAQAELIKKTLDTTTVPFVFCGDLNSTPSSYVYHILSKNLKDAYLQNHLGWQSTYFSKIPSMRIDVVLMNSGVDAIDYNSPRLKLSDHTPIITNLIIR
jgi:endonuclease/exonuclease/phosphatase family metal-dependent hydrolase